MEQVSENNNPTPFPFEALEKTLKTPAPESVSVFTAESYDNRARISELASSLGSKLDSLAQTLSTNSYLSESFSWLAMTAQSSDLDIAIATAYENAEENVWLLNTRELAKTRAHTTISLTSVDRTDFDTDTYEFDLTVGSDVYGIELLIDNDDTDPLTNHEMLLRLARVFNSSGADVSASVSTSYKKVSASYYEDYGLEEVSFLELVSGDSGKDESFYVEDTTGELIEILGLDQTLVFGRNSEYTVDGGEFEFYSNTIELDGDAVQAYLTGESDSSELTQIEAKYGFSAAAESVTNVIGEYNNIIEWIDENDYFISNSLKKALFEDLNSAVLETQTVSYESEEAKSFAVVQGDVTIYNVSGYDASGFFPRLNEEKHPTVESELSDIGLTLNSDGTLDMATDFETHFKSRFREIYDSLAGDDGFFTKIGAALEEIRSADDDRYVYSKNHVLVYATDAGTEARKIYQENVSTLINVFA